MLTQLNIQNIALVESLSIEFQSGMTVITGETGAGKSIIIDALELALGARANNTLIREGHEKAEVTAVFDIQQITAAKAWLTAQDLLADNDCIIRRVISQDGRNRCFINNTPTSLQALKELGETLISIHGQHENQTLLRPEEQRRLVDAYAQHADLLQSVLKHYEHWRACTQALEALQNQTDQKARLDFLKFQLDELATLNVKSGEYEDIDHALTQAQHSHDIVEHQQTALNLLTENAEYNIQDLLARATHELEALCKFDPAAKNAAQSLREASIQIDEAISELQEQSSHSNNDPETLASLEQRLSMIHEVARKHHTSPEQLVALREQLESELSNIEHREERAKALTAAIQAALNDYQQSAIKLTESRKKVSKKLNTLISERMHHLGMPDACFEIEFKSTAEPNPLGNETLNFLVNTNPGMPMQSLNKTASGGELSRISLAIQVITAEQQFTPVLVFDEVDVGIGGPTADIIGEQLALLGKTHQVFCITHLSQVAAHGANHLHVHKETIKAKTYSRVTVLDRAGRIQEMARMMGGKTSTKQLLSHAEELLRALN